jgi:hypothetical protein
MYKLILSPRTGELGNVVLRLSDNTFITEDENSSSWREYQDWLAEGNTSEPADPLPPEPAPLTPQEKLAAAGLSVAELKELLGL